MSDDYFKPAMTFEEFNKAMAKRMEDEQNEID